jgi:hypothetical protein
VEFDGKHITHDTVAKIIEKLKETGSVADQPRSGHARASTINVQTMWCWQRLEGVPKQLHTGWLQSTS